MTDTTASAVPVLSSYTTDKFYEIEHLGIVIDGRFVGQHLRIKTTVIPDQPTRVTIDVWRLTGSSTWSNHRVGGLRIGGGGGRIRPLSEMPAEVLDLIRQVDPGLWGSINLIIAEHRSEES